MSKKKDPAADKAEARTARSNLYSYLVGKPSDFWWNVVYFVILSAAITFILINNTFSGLLRPTGIIIISVLILLDLFPAVYLARFVIRYIRLKRQN